jgi:hypothetical protein
VTGIAVACLALAGCYSPSLRDCTLSCGSPDDCAAGQVCGADGWCAAPAVAGRCPGLVDAGPRDAGPADASPDAAMTILLRVQIDGKGSILVDGHGSCSSQGAQHGDCTFTVAARVALTAYAVAIPLGNTFTGWTSATCKDAPATCTFTPMVATTIVAKFQQPSGPNK